MGPLGSTDLAQAWPCFLTSLCLDCFVRRTGIRSTSVLRLLGVWGCLWNRGRPGGCAVSVSPPDTQPLSRAEASVRSAVRGWPRGHVIQGCPSVQAPPRLPPPSCSHRRPGHCRAGSGDRAPWRLCLPGISSFRSLRPGPPVVTPTCPAGPSLPRPVVRQDPRAGAEEERDIRTRHP